MEKAILILQFIPLVSFSQSKYNFLVDGYLSKKRKCEEILIIL